MSEVISVDFLMPIASPSAGRVGFETIEAMPATGGAAPDPVVYHMAVWNTTNGEWVRWTVNDAPDPGGAAYPGPGTFGVDTQTPAIVEYVD